ncbi:YjeF N-terminal domain-like protein [Trichocladium antarcticum]|uniref:Enhancer of mRNA-decapping protein 3 n=1 Tax=Trichocladium antarcticum TaxID=1450529 RepID=A0AAN6UQV9_9PEZI|nr:YjeF N-terminal domain-like protein [Trichocladium antarcticum]
MASSSEFIGVQMLVTLKDDPPTRLRGTVSAVEAGTGLTLSNVWVLNTNEWKPRITIAATAIADLSDLSEVPKAAPPNPAPTAQPTAPPAAPPVPQPPQPPPKSAFVDPAILAVGRPPAATSSSRAPDPQSIPTAGEKRAPAPVIITSVHVASTSREATPTAAAATAFKGLNLQGVAATVESAEEKDGAEVTLEYGEVAVQKKKRRQRKAGNAKSATEDYEASPAPATKTAGKGKGWRQTPILQSTASFQPFSSLKRPAKGRQAVDNGWASEDVTDVQVMGDFDFESSLAKFDKQHLFEQMRKEDKIDEADRLVSQNRQPRPKPGTAGGKNYHHSENVLDTPSMILKSAKDRPASNETPNDFWNSEADDGLPKSGERLSGRDTTGMGSRQGSRRGASKVSTGRRSRSRQASEAVRTGSGPSRVNAGAGHYRTQSFRGSRPSSRLSSRTATADKRRQLPTPCSSSQGLYMLPSNRRVEPVSALQMFNIENIAHNEIGLTEEMMTENAGRGIAEVTLTTFTDPAMKVRHAGTTDPATGALPPPPPPPPPQTVVVLAGNNKSGSRAVAAARHLRNKGVNVLVCVVGLERGERDLLEDVQQQVRLYRNLGGRALHKADLFEHLRKISLPLLTVDTPRSMSLSSLANPAPVMLIVDALLGLAISFEELRNGDQATVYELIEWANRNEAFVLSVDVPSGVDPTTGKVCVVDGNRLYVKPRYVVAVGAPKKGLLDAMVAADDDGGADGEPGANAGAASAEVVDDAVAEWKLFLVDLGLGQAVWKKAGTKMRKGVEFDGRWVVGMRYRGVESEGGEEDL